MKLMKQIFKVDWVLGASFLLCAISGIIYHVAGHQGNHHVWEIWAIVHSLLGLSFLTLAVWHIKMHKGWYKSFVRNSTTRQKGRVTMLVSLLFTIAAITGLALLFIWGEGTEMGMWHYRIGLVTTILLLLHFAKRFPILKKSITI